MNSVDSLVITKKREFHLTYWYQYIIIRTRKHKQAVSAGGNPLNSADEAASTQLYAVRRLLKRQSVKRALYEHRVEAYLHGAFLHFTRGE